MARQKEFKQLSPPNYVVPLIMDSLAHPKCNRQKKKLDTGITSARHIPVQPPAKRLYRAIQTPALPVGYNKTKK